MRDKQKWGDETRDKKNGEMRGKTEKKWGDGKRDQKNGEMRCKTKKNGETR